MPISKFESLAQGFIEGSFSRLLGGKLSISDVAMRLTQALEQSFTHGVAANRYTVRLAPADYDALYAQAPNIAQDMAGMLETLAQQAQAPLAGVVRVVFVADPSLRKQEMQIETNHSSDSLPETTQLRPNSSAEDDILLAITELDAYLIVDGRTHIPLDKPIITIGRRQTNDIVLDEPTISRQHAQLRWRYGRFILYDLSNRNGRTRVNGQPITECVLQPGDVIALSQNMLIYGEGRTQPRRGRNDNSISSTQIMPPTPTEGEAQP